ncbi:MAG: F0F1 ATP synthase subunit A [Chloroflexota bacterium]
MNSNTRGLLIFGGIVAFVAIVCYWIPYVGLGLIRGGSIAAMPVIEVPGEILTDSGFPFVFFGFDNLTNTWTSTLFAGAASLVFAGLAWRASNGWTKENNISLFQAWAETIVEALYGVTKQFAGDTPQVRTLLFPITGTIFIFLLAANLMTLLPGVDSVGELHCAHGAQSGYMRIGQQLYNPTALNAGRQATEIEEHACNDIKKKKIAVPFDDDDNGIPAYDEAREADINEAAALLNDSNAGLSDAEFEAAVAAYEEATGFEHVVYFPDADELERGVQPYSFVVTPFFRPAATDLNLTLGLALFAFFWIQYFGVSALGIGYFQKFINIGALGNIQKNPIGGVDFLVGLFEIVSEFAKVISLAFRLFGNIFAGMVLIFVMHFLVATGLPAIFFGLESIIGFAQAAVFAVLTLIFCAQAMVSHHHDDDHDEHH